MTERTETARNHTTGETHKVRQCRHCMAPIVFLKSKAGNWFAADVVRWTGRTEDSFGSHTTGNVVQPWRGRHVCGPAEAPESEAVKAARVAAAATLEAANEALGRFGFESPEFEEAEQARMVARRELKKLEG